MGYLENRDIEKRVESLEKSRESLLEAIVLSVGRALNELSDEQIKHIRWFAKEREHGVQRQSQDEPPGDASATAGRSVADLGAAP